MLIGTAREVIEAFATTNVAAEPDRHYQVSPAEHFAQIRRCRDLVVPGAAAVNVVGVYHSHPRSAPVPSSTDLEEAFGEFLYIITGPTDGSAASETRAARLQAGGLSEVRLTVA